MQWMYPSFLWALAALSLPILVHLFNFRPQILVRFSNTRLLKNLNLQSQNMRRIKHLVVLASRLLALAFLVMAFAQPFLAGELKEDASEGLVLYLDNSPSMLEEGEGGSLFNQAKSTAVDLLKSLPENSRVLLASNDPSAQYERSFSPTEARAQIDKLEIYYGNTPFDSQLQRLDDLCAKQGWENYRILVWSDFQKSKFPNLMPADSLWQERLQLIPLRHQQALNNIWLDSAWMIARRISNSSPAELGFRLKRMSNSEATTVNVGIHTDRGLLETKTVEFGENTEADFSVSFLGEATAELSGYVEINSGSPYFDNNFYFANSQTEAPRVLVVAPDALRDRFDPLFRNSGFALDYAEMGNLSPTQIESADLLILVVEQALSSGLLQKLDEALERGVHILLMPESSANGLNQSLAYWQLGSLGTASTEPKRAIRIQWEDPLYREAFLRKSERPDLPVATSVFSSAKLSRRWQSLLQFADEEALLSSAYLKSGRLLLLNAPLAENPDIMGHTVMIPTVYNALRANAQSAPLYTYPNRENGPAFSLEGNGDQVLELQLANGEVIIPPQIKRGKKVEVYELPNTLKPALYPILYAQKPLGNIALNVPKAESQWSFYEAKELDDAYDLYEGNNSAALQASFGNLSERALWPYCVMLALLFFIVEFALLKYWK